MALTFTSNELTSGRSIGFTGTKDQLTITWTTQYAVDALSDTLPFDYGDVSPYDVITASGLPVVNRSVYFVDSKIIPFVICRDKKAKMNPKLKSRWVVTCKWQGIRKAGGSESDDQPISPPAALTDITPKVVSELGEIERVLYTDKSSTPKPILTPSSRYYAEPAIERIPTLTLKISQYEASITYDQMLERKLKVNSGTYRSQPRYDWLIEDVEAVDVDVELAGGTTTAALVTYTISHNPLLYGWKDDRALIDSHYLDGSVFKPFMDGELRSINQGFVEIDGAKKTGTTPDYDQFETYDDIDFDSFLQV